jgi:hypothetical protein
MDNPDDPKHYTIEFALVRFGLIDRYKHEYIVVKPVELIELNRTDLFLIYKKCVVIYRKLFPKLFRNSRTEFSMNYTYNNYSLQHDCSGLKTERESAHVEIPMFYFYTSR